MVQGEQRAPASEKIQNVKGQALKKRASKTALKMLNENKKEVQLLRSECATLEHHATETTNDILKEIIEDIANLEKDFLKLQHTDVNEINFIK